MKKILAIVLSGMLAAGAVSSVAAGDFDKQIKARQAHMQLYSFNLGILGAMAKGEMEYNADLAKASADNLLAVATMNAGAMWPQGSDMAAAGNEGKTWAKPEIWTTFPESRRKRQGAGSGCDQDGG